MNLNLPKSLQRIVQCLTRENLDCFLVGGSVRDALMLMEPKDFDVEVFGIDDLNTLKELLQPFGKVVEVGKAFGVVKFVDNDVEIDFSLARTEKNTGPGHRGFETQHDKTMKFETAAFRRDFTINAIGINLKTQEIMDPFNGQDDIKRKCLRHVSDAFAEDPLRVFRAMQFSARFGFDLHPDTVALCKTMDVTELPKERLFEEFNKCLLKAAVPSKGFDVLLQLELLRHFPELEALIDVPQDPEWHPEGDVWVHTLQVIDEMAKLRTGDDRRDLILMYAALCHDLGKPPTTEFIEGRWRSRGHEEAGVEVTRSFLHRLTLDHDLIEQVLALVKDHLKPALLYKESLKHKVSDGAIRRLALRVPLDNLVLLSQADHLGRKAPNTTKLSSALADFDAEAWLIQRAKQLNVADQRPKPILLGRHLIELGIEPGPKMGKILKQAFNYQLDGKLNTLDELIDWVKKNKIKKTNPK